MKIHIDKNSIIHFCVCFTPSVLAGIIGASYALYEGIKKENSDDHFCWWDLFFDLLGIILGLCIHFILILWIS